MEKAEYYVKSLEEDFATKTLVEKKKVTFQTINEIVKTRTIKPNTVSFGRERRLSCTHLHENYVKTYRPHGLIFKTEQKPEYISPFDLVLVTATEKVIVHYYRIKNNLHLYYNQNLIPGFEKYLFKDFNTMISKFPSPEKAWEDVRKFRVSKGYPELPKQKFRLAQYNEVVFYKPVKIIPVAIFGYTPLTRRVAQEVGLPAYRSAKEFYERNIAELKINN